MADVRVRPLECGWLTTEAHNMLEGGSGSMRMPVASFLLEHADGTVVFDFGMHPELQHDTSRMGITEAMFAVQLEPRWTLAGQLEEVGVAPDDVDVAVASHLHFDHAGGLGQLPDARLVVQHDEWAAAFDETLVELGVFNPGDFDLGHDRQEVEGEHDLFGDGSLVLVPTPGHTAGHQSLLVEGRLLLVGDACYCQQALDEDALPPFPIDGEQQRAGFAWLRHQQAAGIDVVFSHDADQWATLGPEL
jgi:glyoxylase-like metal-dependent hydrolase (beta-lactamase superfamily II)